jgi:hypothetical protein
LINDQEILESQKLIADIRNVLTDLAGITDPEKLTALVLEKVPWMFDGFYQLVRHRPTIFGSMSDCDTVNIGLAAMQSVAEMAKRDPDWKAKLIPAVAKLSPSIDATLDKVAQVLREKAPKAPEVP